MTDTPTTRTVYSLAVAHGDRILVPSRPIRLVDCEPLQCAIGDAVPIERITAMPDSVMWRVPIDINGTQCALFKRTPYAPEPASKIEVGKVIWGWERTA